MHAAKPPGGIAPPPRTVPVPAMSCRCALPTAQSNALRPPLLPSVPSSITYPEEFGILAVVQGIEEGAQVRDGVDHRQDLGGGDDLHTGRGRNRA